MSEMLRGGEMKEVLILIGGIYIGFALTFFTLWLSFQMDKNKGRKK